MPLNSTTHSVNQILYFGTGTATPVSEGTGFSINMPTQFADDSQWGDTFVTQIPGMRGFSGQIVKHYDHNETNLRSAAIARAIGKYYWYPDRAVVTDYVYGTAYVSMANIQANGLNVIIGNQYDMVAASAPTWMP